MNPKYAALFTSVNLLLGAGPLILPAPYFQAGFLLSTIWLIIIIFISYNSALYIAESMSKIYYIQLEKSKTSILSSSDQGDLTGNQQLISVNQDDDQPELESIDHSQQLLILYGRNMKIACALAITIYLLGTAISKCIMTAKTLSKVFQSVDYVGTIQFWLICFFLCGALFSFKSIEKTAVLQTIIIGVRTISILFMIGGAFYLIITNGAQSFTPKNSGIFNISKFTQIFSNSVFALMFHHSFPGIAAQVKNSTDLRFFLRSAFLISGSLLILIPMTGIMAFGDDLGGGSSQSDLKYYNFDFQNRIDFIYYFVSFYVFLNIAAIPVYVIVVRSNVLKISFPEVDSKSISKHTLIATFAILTFIIVVAFFAKNQIQIVLDFTGGIFGILILFFIPSLQVYQARRLTHKANSLKNYNQYLPFILMVLGGIFMLFNLYQIIKKLIQTH